MRPLIAAAVSASIERGGGNRPVLLVSSTFREAEELTAALQSLVGEEAVAYYPAWETLPHERLSPRSDTVGRRLELLRQLAGNSSAAPPRIVVAPVRSILQPQVKGLGRLKPIRLAVGSDIDLTDLAAALVGAAYTRVDLVERRGEFAVRGGIVDVFPPTEEHPVRVDFFGDTVEIRYFSVAIDRQISH
jgi:transcription-repair coupling factor (superfamily II helicase)